MRYASAPFNHVYLVSDKQNVFSHDEIAFVEQELGFPLSDTHKHFLQVLGHGVYCGHVRVFSPKEIISRNPIPWSAEETEWAEHSRFISPEIIKSSTVVASTIDGDNIIVSPLVPDKVYVLLRGSLYR
jgi:hypothetical protein